MKSTAAGSAHPSTTTYIQTQILGGYVDWHLIPNPLTNGEQQSTLGKFGSWEDTERQVLDYCIQQ